MDPMIKIQSLLIAGCLTFLGGCAAEDIRDSLWDVFGGGYTAGGVTEADRRQHYDAQAERWNSPHAHYNPTAER
jgi:hypothetical protein